MIVLHTAIAIVLVIVLIIRFKVDPVISLVISSLYLGLAAGVGFTGTIKAITTGFGEIMTKVGLLIDLGVLIGSLLHACGVFGLLVNALVRVVGGAGKLDKVLSAPVEADPQLAGNKPSLAGGLGGLGHTRQCGGRGEDEGGCGDQLSHGPRWSCP